MDLIDLFEARAGIVGVVGAGGKKTAIFRLAESHPGRMAITSTVLTPPFRRRLGAAQVVAEPGRLLQAVGEAAEHHARVAYACPSMRSARFGGVPPELVSQIHRELGFDVTLVKADGARLRWLKAPGDGEPVLPPGTNTVIPVSSIRVVGKPLSPELVHRVDAVSRVTGAAVGDRLTATHMARLIASDQGGLKSAGDARVVPLINMVETREQRQLAELVAALVLEWAPRVVRVVIAAMEHDNPLVAVIER